MPDPGRNGTYVVFRELAQHVTDLWRLLEDASKRSDGSSDPIARERLGADFIGEWFCLSDWV